MHVVRDYLEGLPFEKIHALMAGRSQEHVAMLVCFKQSEKIYMESAMQVPRHHSGCMLQSSFAEGIHTGLLR